MTTEAPMTRRTLLPARRLADTLNFQWGNGEHSLTVGYFDDRQPAEVFINLHSATCGSELEAVARDGAILVSLALQHGCPLETIRGALTRTLAGEPRTVIGSAVDTIIKGVK